MTISAVPVCDTVCNLVSPMQVRYLHNYTVNNIDPLTQSEYSYKHGYLPHNIALKLLFANPTDSYAISLKYVTMTNIILPYVNVP